jgi:putative ABC transport system ATP-binding protein
VTHVPTGDSEPPAARGARDTGPRTTGTIRNVAQDTSSQETDAQDTSAQGASAHNTSSQDTGGHNLDRQNVGTSALSRLDALFASTDPIATTPGTPGTPATATATENGNDDDSDNGNGHGNGARVATGAGIDLGAPGGGGRDAVREPATSTLPVLELVDIQQIYGTGDAAVHALRGITLSVHAGDYVAIMGPSGSGKSTLMNLLGCLDIASSGVYSLAGNDVATLNEAQLAVVRNKEIGFIFQSFNLVPRMSAVANVELPLVYGGVKRAERRRRALEALDMVGLGHRANHQPQELSGGQQQRVAIARALVTNPTLVLADEPTGNLDSESTEEILGIFDTLARQGRTIVIITHEDHVAERAHRVLAVSDGLIVVDRPARKEALV